MKIILLGANGLTKELAAEITQSPESGEETSSSSLEVIKVEEAYERVKVELLTRRPHGCIAVYSDRTTFDYCHEWLTASLVDFKGDLINFEKFFLIDRPTCFDTDGLGSGFGGC